MMYSIPEVNFETLCKKVNRIQKKAIGAGTNVTFSVVGEHFDKVVFKSSPYPVVVKYIDVEAEGIVKANGWSFVATIEHTEHGNIVRNAPNMVAPEWARTAECRCEHCNTKQRRKDTYLVKEDATGVIRQVGRSCLKEYTGGLDVSHAAMLLSYIDLMEESTDFCGDTGMMATRYWGVHEYLLNVAETIRAFGYVSSTAAMEREDHPVRTSSLALTLMTSAYSEDEELRQKTGYNPARAENEELVAAALSWVAAQSGTDYIENLKVAYANEYCEARDMGIIASLLPSYHKAQARKAENEKRVVAESCSQHVGTIGQRIETTVSLTLLTSWETQYGYTNLYRMMDSFGNVYTWKTGNVYSNGDYTCKGTVKAHSEFRGTKQTELTRCKLTDLTVEQLSL